MDRRQELYQSARSRLLSELTGKAFGAHGSMGESVQGWSHAMMVWAETANCQTAQQARVVVGRHAPGKKRRYLQSMYWRMPWEDLYKVLNSLPTELD